MPPRPRSDARRNHDAVIAAALRLLSADPEATMREIADASGLTRTTVYRHFPAREELLRAIFGVVAREADAAALTATAGDPPLEQVAAAIARSSVALGRRFRFLAGHDALADDAAQTAGDEAMVRWLAIARERGEVRDDMPVAWQARVMRSIAVSAVETHLDGDATAAEAELLLAATVVAALAAPSAAG
ncbi:helix-turn-helix domain-containing protein [Conexibacter stalactiti]|uniref:Helix-turn-helix domain-containing protein n=1 Tax=Conexibacter stalactiti TaxID=1940611 RepID=A0ABU4HHM3_9ACTN|nr:helix-turn-helix domain-containing protein [Conexibacter stalactiti]MDW5592811.1 helix-turn-helix domain-containing protein [Conexibacter stalactiti]MEC5033452.1 helix-turn-helix domain-containing protein [Conexibacter stalactiti]